MSDNNSSFSLRSLYDYKKHASSVIKQQDAEQAFMQISSTILEDKAAPIFKDPYYLGFEIVKANDSYTKMIGVYVFRLGRNLFYAPVFYIDGRIKCTDLLYNVDTKMFTPLSQDWCEYYVNKLDAEVGTPLEKAISSQAKQQADLQYLAYPRSHNTAQKFGSSYTRNSGIDTSDIQMMVKMASSDFDASLADAFAFDDDSKILHNFIKHSPYSVFDKFANTALNNEEFGINVAKICVADDLIIDSVINAERDRVTKIANTIDPTQYRNEFVKNKFAKIANMPLLTVHKGKFNKEGVKYASDASVQIEKGYTFEDKREDNQISNVMCNIEDEDIANNYFTAVSKTGVYDVLNSNGDLEKFFIVTGTESDSEKPHACSLLFNLDNKDNGILVDKTSTYPKHDSTTENLDVYSYGGTKHLSTSILAVEDTACNLTIDDVADAVPVVGKIYCLYNPQTSTICLQLLYVKSVEAMDNGGHKIAVVTASHLTNSCTHFRVYANDPIKNLFINPNAKHNDLTAGVLTSSTKWLAIPTEVTSSADCDNNCDNSDNSDSCCSNIPFTINVYEDFQAGDVNTLFNLSTQKLNYSSAKLAYSERSNSYSLIINDNNMLLDMTKFACKAALMVNANIRETTASKLIDQAFINDVIDFKYENKFAARIVLDPDPAFYTSYDTDLGVETEEPQSRVLTTQDIYYGQPAPRFGDAMPVNASDTSSSLASNSIESADDQAKDNLLETTDANVLADLAIRSGKRSVFEHGVVGSLARTTTIDNYLEDFLPDMRRGLDKFGRMLFLITIKPQEFIKRFGSDDIEELENSITNVFKQTGEVVLKLMQKSNTDDKLVNTTPVTSAEQM